MPLRTYATFGVSLNTLDSWDTDARFNAAPAATTDFQSVIAIDDVVAKIGAGVQLSMTDRLELRAQFGGEFGGTAQSHTGLTKSNTYSRRARSRRPRPSSGH
jgi:hypothetical protein